MNPESILILYILKPSERYDCVLSILNDPAGSHISVGVIALAVTDLHSADARVDERELPCLIVGAYHNAHMTDIPAAASACEENEIPLAEMLSVYRLALGILGARRRADRIAELFVYVT